MEHPNRPKVAAWFRRAGAACFICTQIYSVVNNTANPWVLLVGLIVAYVAFELEDHSFWKAMGGWHQLLGDCQASCKRLMAAEHPLENNDREEYPSA